MPHYLKKVYRSFRYGRSIVIVSGLPRSGTSMTMKMLEAGGMDIVADGIRTADEDNPKGYYELERVKNLHREPDKTWLRDARGKAIKIISYLLRSLPRNNNYKVLFMNRNLHEIIASQNKMLSRRGEASSTSDDRMLKLFENDLREVKFLLRRRPYFETMDVHYGHALEDPAAFASRITSFVGLNLDTGKMATVADRNLYRNRAEPIQQPGN